MITIQGLSMHYGTRLLFDNVCLNLNKGSRYGLVGANGVGKTTFLKILMQVEEPAIGTFTCMHGARIGWMQQNHFLYEDTRLIDVVIQGKENLWNAMTEKDAIFAEGDATGNWTDEMGYRLGELEEIIGINDGYTAESVAHTLLTGIGIPEHNHEIKMRALSGGYKLRVLLAQALFNNPDILLLDEPTNHLDILTIGWLENYLQYTFQGCLVFISHDQLFLNGVSTHILDIDYGEINQYTGNYDHFLKLKSETAAQRLKTKEHIEKKIADMQVTINRFKATASKAKQSQSKMKMIDKMEVPDVKQSSRVAPYFSFQKKRPSGKSVLTARDISMSYGDKKVLTNVNFSVARGERIAIVGNNGIGKSTLLKILTNNLTPQTGSFEWGFEAQHAYFAQDHHEQLDEDATVYDWLFERKNPDNTITDVRGILGRVLFSKDDVEKKIPALSGGESARLLLAHIMLQQGNILIMDEPTNHLDLESTQALMDALQKFDGTLIFVSHNRYFLERLANRVMALTDRGVTDHQGTYQSFCDAYGADYLSRMWLKSTEVQAKK